MKNERYLCLILIIYCHYYAVFASPRVRREIRTLSDDQRERVFSALNVMKNIEQDQGQSLYGSFFRNYDLLIAKHINATVDPRGDQAHLGPAFPTYHRAFILEFELSLMSVDPLIEAVPYWDYNLDIPDGVANSVVWEWFGNARGKKENMYAIEGGRFSNWTVRGNASDISGRFVNAFGRLRSPWNNNPSPFVTRMETSCGANTNFDAGAWSFCLKASNLMAWYTCQQPSVHTFAHTWIGGIWNTKFQHSREQCFLEHTLLVPAAWSKGCIICPTHCTDPVNLTKCDCHVSKEFRCLLDHVISPEATLGDMSDNWSSPNDPIFFFHHANVVRYFTIWQQKHKNLAPLYGYPKTWFPTPGQELDHEIASKWGFDPALIGQPNRTSLITHKDMVQMDGFSVPTPWTYDKLY